MTPYFSRFLLLALLFSLLSSARVSPTTQRLHESAIVVDTHVDTVLRMLDRNLKLGEHSTGHIDIPKMKAGGLDVVFFSVWVAPSYKSRSKARAEELIRTIKAQVSANHKDIEMAYSYKDVKRIVGQNKIAALLGLEGSHPLLGKVDNLDHFYRLGIRYIGLTWSIETPFAGSSGKHAKHHGLTPLGQVLLKRMNTLGMLVDLSHASDSTFYDVIKMSRAPVIASHSSSRHLCPVPRNLDNQMLRALAKNGGVAGVNFFPGFIKKNKKATLSDVVDHIEYMLKVGGKHTVGLGSDYDGIKITPKGLENASRYPSITQELKRRGHSDATITKVLGGNFLRVMSQVLK